MKKDKSYPILFIWTNEKREKKNKKYKAMRVWDHLTPNIIHMSLCMCICLYNLICSHVHFNI